MEESPEFIERMIGGGVEKVEGGEGHFSESDFEDDDEELEDGDEELDE